MLTRFPTLIPTGYALCRVHRKTKVSKWEQERSGEQRLRLPAGKPVLISTGFETHLVELFNIPF